MSPRLRLHEHEDGVALISVLFAVLVLTGLATLFMSRSINESRFSGQSQRFESAIHAAEAGADQELGQANGDAEYSTENPDDSGNPYYLPAGLTEGQERSTVLAWALAANDNDPATGSGGTVRRQNGTFFGVRPVDADDKPRDLIYAVGFVPALERSVTSEAAIPAGTQVRVVKYAIAQDFFTPDFALHTGGALKLGGNSSIRAEDCDPAAPTAKCDANIQVNGTMDSPGTSNSVQGEVRVAGGTCPATITSTGGCVDQGHGVVAEPMPTITARQFYDRHDEKFTPDQGGQTVGWFDLCPDQRIYAPSAAGPCDTTQVPIWDSRSGSTFLGWKYQAGKWMATKVQAGVFYVYGSDASISGTHPGQDATRPRAVTVFVESDPARQSTSGSLVVTGAPKVEAAFPDILFVADRDIRLGGGGSGGTHEYAGFISAYEQLNANSTMVLKGALFIQDREEKHPEVTRNTAAILGNLTLDYDRTLSLDLTGYYTITHWSEL